jgi:hypothetical protein
MTREVANELWIARENLSRQGKRTDLDANASKFTWSSYCAEIGISYKTADRWLNQWFPESLTLENKPLVSISKPRNFKIRGRFLLSPTFLFFYLQ